jgi:hypothetical protein
VRLDADQLEWIVREVVRRLREGAAGAAAPIADGQLTLPHTLITAATLEHRLEGVARVSVPPRAVVTPAARDLLKERNIELRRSTDSHPN